MSENTRSEKPAFTAFPVVVWLRDDPLWSGYVCEKVELGRSGWLQIRASGWLTQMADGTHEPVEWKEPKWLWLPPQVVQRVEINEQEAAA